MISGFFLKQPYFALVLAILITLIGAVAYTQLPVAQYPPITPPEVQISTTYPGADAVTLLQTVVEPIESQVNGVRDMIYMSSTSADSGSATITVSFDIGSDPERNTQNVQSRVNWATPQLPTAVQREGVIVKEQTGNILLVISLYSPANSYDTLFLSNYASINLINELNRIPGIGNIVLFGGADYSMRVWLDADKLASLNLPVAQVLSAIQSQNMQVSAGAIGAAPDPARAGMRYTVQTNGRLVTEEQFGNIVVRSDANGALVKLRDVAQIQLGAQSYDTTATLNGQPTILLGVYQLSNANGLDISAACRAKMAELSKNFPPNLAYGFQYDSTNFIRASIQEVLTTLLIAVGLVVLVTYVFLQKWRMTLVPALAIPVSLVGTFAFLKIFGFSINLVTLFALILAIGIVVDDAIIVIENVSRLMEQEKLSPAQAAFKSMQQMSGAIIATTAVLLAMFVPICFLPGITGELYRQFGVTISVAVALSAFNALTLSPVLSALLLKPDDGKPRFFLFRWFNAALARIVGGYSRVVRWLIAGVAAVLLVYFGFTAFTGWFYQHTPTGFLPTEDQGYLFANLQLPSASSLARTETITLAASEQLKSIPGVQDVLATPGFNLLEGIPASNSALLVIILDDWSKRGPLKLTSERLMMEAYGKLRDLPEATPIIFEPPPIPGIGVAGGFNFVVEETDGIDPDSLARSVYALVEAANQSPELRGVYTTFDNATPYLELTIDRDKAFVMGIELETLYTTLEGLLGSTYVNDFNRYGQVYQVQVQAGSAFRDLPGKIDMLYVSNPAGEQVPLSTLVHLKRCYAPQFLARYNLYLSAEVQGNPAPGYSSGTAMTAMEKLADDILTDSQRYNWTDMSYQEQKAGHQVIVIFLLAGVFIYLFLAALYASWLLPFSVMLSIPLALCGALLLLHATGIANNFYVQVGLVLLFAMACKTAILIVNFARDRHNEGAGAVEAAEFAAKLRFRAVLMTAFSFILGTLPLALASGPGAMSQRALGTAVVGGMTLAVAGGLLMIPVFYVACQKLIDLTKR